MALAMDAWAKLAVPGGSELKTDFALFAAIDKRYFLQRNLLKASGDVPPVGDEA
jgi:hypothetical protein